MGAAFIMLNRNKRSMVLDLALEPARAVFLRLVRTSDVLVENLRPGQMEKLGLGYETLDAINPGLIYASVSAYGHRGPEASSRGFDQLAQARAGILDARRHHDGTPVSPACFAADLSCAMMLAYAVLLCVVERQKSGRGQRIDGSLLGAAIALNPAPLVRVCADPALPRRPENPLTCAYPCADGRYVILSAPVPGYWRPVCEALGLHQLIDDEAFAAPARRLDNADALRSILRDAFLSRAAREWVRIFAEQGVPCGLVQAPEEVFDDPQVRANELMLAQNHPVLGMLHMPGLPFKLSRTAGDIRSGAPLLGEHSHAILRELGFNEAEVRTLEQAGATRGAPANGAKGKI
jgi:crotonobetainyl-CoA:carnitine CoA-transferase CaiB-like acyl-CoA transferase